MSKDLALEIMEKDFHISHGQENELLSFDKEAVRFAAQSIVFPVSDGEADPVREYLKVRKALDILNEAEKNLKPYFDALPLNKGEKYYGYEILEKMMGVKTDYTTCKDQEWLELNGKIEKLKEDQKLREKFLSGITTPVIVVCPETGDISEIFPAVKSGKLGKQLTLK